MSSEKFAQHIRLKTLEIVYKAKASHIGGALSMVDLLAVLYSRILNFDFKKMLTLHEANKGIGTIASRIAKELLR